MFSKKKCLLTQTYIYKLYILLLINSAKTLKIYIFQSKYLERDRPNRQDCGGRCAEASPFFYILWVRKIRPAYTVVLITLIPGLTISRIVLQM